MEINPIVISVTTLCVLCLLRINVLFSLMISAITAGLVSGMDIQTIMNLFVSGMGKNSETALSYILLGTLAASMTHTGLAEILSFGIFQIIKNNKYLLLGILTLISVMSQNLIPVHIAFIPILIPPLISLMNKLKLDRRSAACCLVFGLKMPYIAIPAGFGLIFQGLIADNMNQNGMNISKADIWHYNWILGVGMFFALLIAVFISYSKDRIYIGNKEENEINKKEKKDFKLKRQHYITLTGTFAALAVQLFSGSLPLGALVGLGIIFGFRAVSHKKMDFLINEGVGMMGYIAFVMLVCAGYALVIQQSLGLDTLLNSLLPYIGGSKLCAAVIMLLIGLLITVGIGSSFGTIPVLAVLFVPLCEKMGFSTPSVIILLSAAAALGDAGSPVSDTTLGPTSGLNIDKQHDHIRDTCIPAFLHYNTALIITALAAVCIFG